MNDLVDSLKLTHQTQNSQLHVTDIFANDSVLCQSYENIRLFLYTIQYTISLFFSSLYFRKTELSLTS